MSRHQRTMTCADTTTTTRVALAAAAVLAVLRAASPAQASLWGRYARRDLSGFPATSEGRSGISKDSISDGSSNSVARGRVAMTAQFSSACAAGNPSRGHRDLPEQAGGDPMSAPRTGTAAVTALLATLLVCTPAASAASPPVTRQAAAANAAFLAYAPPPSGGARALCLVDTGVNPTPDTAPGLVLAVALDGGRGDDVDNLTHGTIDAAVAGGAGQGVLGAWPQLKIVSVRATDTPEPGQITSFIYDDYARAIRECSKSRSDPQVAAIAIPLASKIPPTPDQFADFNDAVSIAQGRGIGILSAAGNDPGPVQLPGNQPGVLPVGAGDTVGGGICPFSASTGLTFFAPGCTIDQIDSAGNTFCCGNGTSQASAFAAGVYVARRSYAPTLTAAQASQLLVSTAHTGHLDATAAFRGAGLGATVDAGTNAIPKPPPPAAALPPAPPPAATVTALARPRIKRATWRRGVLRITLRGALPKGARLHAKVTFAHHRAMFLRSDKSTLHARTPLPRRVQLHLTAGGASSAKVTIKVTRLRR